MNDLVPRLGPPRRRPALRATASSNRPGPTVCESTKLELFIISQESCGPDDKVNVTVPNIESIRRPATGRNESRISLIHKFRCSQLETADSP